MPPKYIATIKNVREISLSATADANYWAEHLRPEGLFPYRNGNRAELLLSSPDLQWMGIRFSEFVVTVATSDREDGSTRDGLFLVAAFNTNWMLAWMERAFFKTGYLHAPIDFRFGDPYGVELFLAESAVEVESLIRMEQSTGQRDESTSEELWEGRVHLSGCRYFQVKIAGPTRKSAFAAADVFKLLPSWRHPLPSWLIESDCRPVEWHIRDSAVHARSKTFRRESRTTSRS
jgi:hypothetical protein